jgi:hypothetical protein
VNRSGSQRRSRRAILGALLAALCEATTRAASAQPLTHPEIADPQRWTGEFLHFLQEDPAEAYDFARKAGLQPPGTDRLQQATLGQLKNNGKILGADPIGEEHVGHALLRLVYLVLHERGAAVYSFLFYRRPQGKAWELYAMQVVSDPDRFPFTPGPPAP